MTRSTTSEMIQIQKVECVTRQKSLNDEGKLWNARKAIKATHDTRSLPPEAQKRQRRYWHWTSRLVDIDGVPDKQRVTGLLFQVDRDLKKKVGVRSLQIRPHLFSAQQLAQVRPTKGVGGAFGLPSDRNLVMGTIAAWRYTPARKVSYFLAPHPAKSDIVAVASGYRWKGESLLQ
jgi:hypothetical protein